MEPNITISPKFAKTGLLFCTSNRGKLENKDFPQGKADQDEIMRIANIVSLTYELMAKFLKNPSPDKADFVLSCDLPFLRDDSFPLTRPSGTMRALRAAGAF